jgi:hypothetical protein
MLDFNNAGPQRDFDLIPNGTACELQLHLRAGDCGEGGWLRSSKDGSCEMLDCEFVVRSGEYAKRKFWTLLTVRGTTAGQVEAADISEKKILAMLESSRGVKSGDNSEHAKQARRIESYGDLHGLCFIAVVEIGPASGGFKAKNRLGHVVTPDEASWHAVQQDPPTTRATKPASRPASAPAKIERPSWGNR